MKNTIFSCRVSPVLNRTSDDKKSMTTSTRLNARALRGSPRPGYKDLVQPLSRAPHLATTAC